MGGVKFESFLVPSLGAVSKIKEETFMDWFNEYILKKTPLQCGLKTTVFVTHLQGSCYLTEMKFPQAPLMGGIVESVLKIQTHCGVHRITRNTSGSQCKRGEEPCSAGEVESRKEMNVFSQGFSK